MNRIICVTLLFISAFPIAGFAQFPLNLQVTVAPPYPVRLSDYTDFDSQIFIDVTNNSGQTFEIILNGTLTNAERGVRIATETGNPSQNCLVITPGLNRITGADLEELFDPERLSGTGTTIDQIRADQALPEGNYTLCIRAFDCLVPGRALSSAPDIFSGCADFTVSYVDPPIIINPTCGENISSDLPAITFNWLFVPPASGFNNTQFRFRMVEIDPIGRNPFDAMNSATAPYLVDDGDIPNTNYNLLTDADVVLEVGKSYAYQVIAYDPTEEIQFRNNGASEVCWFTYGAAGSGDFSFQPVYPKEGDFIPFDFFPFIIKYTPYSDDYLIFEGDFLLEEKRGGRYSQVDSKSNRNRWPRGPLTEQRNLGFSDMTQEQAQHLPVYKIPSEDHASFQRGSEYAWRFDGNMEFGDGRLLNNGTAQTKFTIGMSPAIQEAPANGSTHAPGRITLQWTSAEKPSRLTPPFDISQYSGSSPVNLFSSTVDERWVLEVSPNTTFDSIYFTDNGRISEVLAGVVDSTAVINALYKQITRDTTFTEEGTYYWRLKWLKNPDDLSSEPYSISPTWNFTIGTSSETPSESETPEGCVSECLEAEITNRTAVEITNGQTVKMGKFDLKITSISNSGSNQYNGEGEIVITFLNRVKVKVNFENVKVNAEGKIFAGKAKAMDDIPHISADSVSTVINGLPVSIPDFNEAQSDALEEVFETGERLVSLIGGSRPMGMPLGLDSEIDDYRFVIAITEMEFNPRKAAITAVSRIDIPALGDKLPAFGARGVCITPSGLGDEYALYLARDHEIYSSGDFQFVFNGTMDGDTTRASYIEFDCTGFKCARISGMVTIPNDKLIPENEDYTIDEDGHVTGTFALKGCRGKNYIGSIAFSAFQVKGMKGWGFKPITAYLDWSDLENPPGFEFPENYEFGSESEPRLVNTWKGFYLKELSLHAPPEFDHDIVGDVEANVQNVIIDNTGFTGSVSIRNLIDYDDGAVEGWAFSMDSLAFGIVQNTSISGGFKGKLGTPIFDDEDYLNYSTALSYHNDTLAYNFRVFVDDTLNVDVWKANMYLAPESQIIFEAGSGIETSLTADLHGGISIEGDLGVPQLSLPGVQFQGLHLSTKDQFRIAHWSFTSPQKSAAGFPLNINDIGFSGGFTNPSLDFDVGLSLSNAGFSAEVGFQLIGRIETAESGRLKFRYNRTRLDAISIDQTMDGGININGSLEFYDEDAVYGNGMRGDVAVRLPMDLAVEVAVQFGTKRTDPTARFNSAGYFSYWYVDGLVTIPGGIDLFPGFAAYGFGGGAYHHMLPASAPPAASASLTAGTTGGSSGVRYVPDFNTALGLKATIVLATKPSKETFNMDVSLEARFNRSGGLDSIGIRGDGFIMADIPEREDAKVTASIAFGYANDAAGGKRVSGNFDVYIRLGDIIKGVGENGRFVHAAMFADSEKWYFHMGKPMPLTERGGLEIDLKVLKAQLTSYLMVGHDIPTTLPPLPDKIRELVYGPQQGSIDGATNASDVNEREMPAYASTNQALGKGFAFGAHLDFETRLDFAIFYAKLWLAFGFDLNVTQDSSRVCYETGLTPGINNWYATGQMYAGLEGELGVQVNLWFIKGEFPIINLAAAFALRGGLPNPAWMEGRAGLRYRILGGLIKGHCNFKAQIGQKCSYVNPNPFSEIEFISGFEPDEGDDDVSVFTYPQVSFALPVNELLELPAGLEDEPDKVRVFYPFVHDITLRDETNRIDVRGRHFVDESNVQARFEPTGALEEFSRHKFEVAIRSYEHFQNGTRNLVRVEGRTWEERKHVTFTSGERPDVIEPAQVSYTYPIDRQAYFLKYASNNNTGLLKYAQSNQNYLFREEDDEGNRYEFFARFIKLEDESNAQQSITLHSDHFKFELPSLDNSTIYGVQIIEKKIEPAEEEQTGSLTESALDNVGRLALSPTIYKALDIDIGAAGSLQLQLAAKKLLPTEKIDQGEKILYKFHFRTSQYSSFQSKMNAVRTNTEYNYLNGSLFENVRLRGTIQEPFDAFEVNGLYKNGIQVQPPMLTFFDRHSVNHFNAAANYVYGLHSEINTLNGRSVPFRFRVNLLNISAIVPLVGSLPTTYSTRTGHAFLNGLPHNTISLTSASQIGEVLQDWELSRAAGIGAYVPAVAPTSSGVSSGAGSFTPSGLSSGINLGSTNVFSETSNIDFNAGTTSDRPFGLNVLTSLYVKLDADHMQSQLARWLATTRTIRLRNVYDAPYTNGEALQIGDPDLYRRISRFLTLPTSYFHYRNGRYRIRAIYKYPGRGLKPGIDKFFTINTHNETVH